MSYEEALNRKKEIGDTHHTEEYDYDVIITPDLYTDYNLFINKYSPFDYNDESCIEFSTNSRFRVIGIINENDGIAGRIDLST